MCKTNNLSTKRNLPVDKPTKEIEVKLDAVRKIMGAHRTIHLESRKDIHESIG